MPKFTVFVDIDLRSMRKAYMKYYGEKEVPKKAELALWIATLAQSDIETFLPNGDNE